MLKYSVADLNGESMAMEARGKLIEIITANKTFNVGDSGKVFGIATDALTLTLPLITAKNLGMEFTIINTAADDASIVTVSPNALDGVNGTIANAAADSVASGTVNKNWVNTKSGANKGDFCTLVAVALTEWYVVAGVGVWASEG